MTQFVFDSHISSDQPQGQKGTRTQRLYGRRTQYRTKFTTETVADSQKMLPVDATHILHRNYYEAGISL